ncbi:MAG: hypothetical protein MRZ79_27320 [Bacteroidia bacterium]|nr:hypothetical protein [Bacteroidia bacterium]
MKLKPHQKQSVIKKVFADFRKRLYQPDKQDNGVQYEVKKKQKGYEVVVHRERGMNQNLFFDSKKELDEFLRSLS